MEQWRGLFGLHYEINLTKLHDVNYWDDMTKINHGTTLILVSHRILEVLSQIKQINKWSTLHVGRLAVQYLKRVYE